MLTETKAHLVGNRQISIYCKGPAVPGPHAFSIPGLPGKVVFGMRCIEKRQLYQHHIWQHAFCIWYSYHDARSRFPPGLDQEKFWSLPLRGFRLGRNSTMDLLHLLWPYEKKPDDVWCCNLRVFLIAFKVSSSESVYQKRWLRGWKNDLNVYLIYTHTFTYKDIYCVCIQLCKIFMSQVINSECKMGFGHCSNVGVFRKCNDDMVGFAPAAPWIPSIAVYCCWLLVLGISLWITVIWWAKVLNFSQVCEDDSCF